MSEAKSETRTVTRRDFLRISGVISALIVTGIKSAAHAAQKAAEKFLARIQAAYAQDAAMPLRKSQENPQLQSLYADFLGRPLGEMSESLLHTGYTDRSAAVSVARPGSVRSLPGNPAIESVYPNPFNASAEIEFRISAPGMVWLAVFNAAGQRVRSLVEERMPAGGHRIRWDGKDSYGRSAPSGMYIARLVSGSRTAATRMTLVK